MYKPIRDGWNYLCTADNLAADSVTVVSGFGVLYFREWGRKLWLAVISFLLVFEGAWFVSDVLKGYLR